MISEKTIQAVRNLDIEVILKPYVKLTRKGTSLVGLCPFHSEKTGSFSVSLGKNLYHCFGCGRGGDGISFVMEKEGMSFTQAVEDCERPQYFNRTYRNRENRRRA